MPEYRTINTPSLLMNVSVKSNVLGLQRYYNVLGFKGTKMANINYVQYIVKYTLAFVLPNNNMNEV